MFANRKWAAAVALLLFVAGYVVAPNFAAAQTVASHGSLPVPVSAQFAPSSTSGPLSSLGSGSFNGTFYIQKFVNNGSNISAVGTLVGTLNGKLVSMSGATAPVTVGDPSCPILTLNIGAIHLDLLGLVVDTSPINVTITAVSGPGNLLGNLLCSVANLLNNPSALSNLLNQILAALGL